MSHACDKSNLTNPQWCLALVSLPNYVCSMSHIFSAFEMNIVMRFPQVAMSSEAGSKKSLDSISKRSEQTRVRTRTATGINVEDFLMIEVEVFRTGRRGESSQQF